MLLLLIPAGWTALALLGLMLCRAAGRSDASHAEAVAEWIAASSDAFAERLPLTEKRGASYRAAS